MLVVCLCTPRVLHLGVEADVGCRWGLVLVPLGLLKMQEKCLPGVWLPHAAVDPGLGVQAPRLPWAPGFSSGRCPQPLPVSLHGGLHGLVRPVARHSS